jgi:hypothetical protein
MSVLGGVGFGGPRRPILGIGAPRDVSKDPEPPVDEGGFRFPGEPETGRSKEMQSYFDAGERFSNFWGGVGDWWNNLKDYAEANPTTTEDIIRGTGTEAFMDPFGISGIPERVAGIGKAISGLKPDGIPFFSNIKEQFSNIFNNGSQAGSTTPVVPPANIVTQQEEQETTRDRTIEELIALAAQYAPQPDYSDYRASLEDMVLNPETGLSPRIQAMYNQLAERAGENQQRISDIYGNATGTVGGIYDSAASNIGGAYSSAQQQAADQMARLGIEEAAGQVIPQAAGQQASALAALEQGRAGGLSALERYGASAGEFGSQMGQVAQQRGLEQNEALLGSLQRQLADSLGMEAQQRAQYNPIQSALQYLQLEQGMNPTADPRAAQTEAEFLYEQEQDDTNVFRQYYQDYYAKTNNQKAARELARADAIAGIMGPRIQQRAMSDPNFVPMASQ